MCKYQKRQCSAYEPRRSGSSVLQRSKYTTEWCLVSTNVCHICSSKKPMVWLLLELGLGSAIECFVKVSETGNPLSLIFVCWGGHCITSSFVREQKKLNFSTQTFKGQSHQNHGSLHCSVCWTHKVYPLVKVKGHQSTMNTISMMQTQLGIV